jgi:hypothetical protein
MADNIVSQINSMPWPVVVSDPAAPDSGDPVRFGSLTGIALNDEGDGGVPGSTYTMVDFGWYVADHPVTDVVAGIAVGDTVYYVDANDRLENLTSGVPYGIALEIVGAGLTATIRVLHCPAPAVGAGLVATASIADGALSADAAGRAKVAADYFNAATVLTKFDADAFNNANLLLAIADGAFQADAATRALFTAGIWTGDYIAAEALTTAKVAESADADVLGAIPVLYHVDIADASADTDIVVTSKIHVADFWIVNSGIAAHATLDTVQLFNGANAISDALAKTAATEAIIRATTLAAAYQDIADGGTLKITAVKDTNVACEAYILAYRIA